MDSKQLKQSIRNLNAGIRNVPYERPIVAAVDQLLKLSKQRGYPTHISNEKDWEIVDFIYKMFASLYPNEHADFVRKQAEMKSNQKNKYASNREAGGAEVRHLLEIPMKFYQMLLAVFPMQKFDKTFAIKLGQRMKVFRWSDTV